MRGLLGQLIEQEHRLAVVDMEASIEHMSRGTARHVDVLLVIAEPYYRSLETAGRIAPLGRELGIPRVYAVANKVRDERDALAVSEYCARHGLEVIAYVPFDEAIASADRDGMALVDYDHGAPAVTVISRLALWLKGTA